MHDSKYKDIFETKYLKISTLTTRGMEYIETLRTNKNNAFWNDVLHSWIILQRQIKPQSISEKLCTNLWNNRSLKIDRKTIFYKNGIIKRYIS